MAKKDKTLHISLSTHKQLKTEVLDAESLNLNQLAELKLAIPLALLKKAKLIK